MEAQSEPAARRWRTSEPAAAARKTRTLCFPVGKSPAVRPAFILACFSFHAPLLSLLTARNAVGAREAGGAQVKEDGKVGRRVAGPKCKICVVEFVTTVRVNMPLIRALGHDEKPCAFATQVVQAAEARTVASCQVP